MRSAFSSETRRSSFMVTLAIFSNIGNFFRQNQALAVARNKGGWGRGREDCLRFSAALVGSTAQFDYGSYAYFFGTKKEKRHTRKTVSGSFKLCL